MSNFHTEDIPLYKKKHQIKLTTNLFQMPLSILKMMRNSQLESIIQSILGWTDGYQIRITDFTKASKQTLCQAPCPPVYLPYEYYFTGQYTQKSHIWQLGDILYFMMTQSYCSQQLLQNHKSKNNQEEGKSKQTFHQQ